MIFTSGRVGLHRLPGEVIAFDEHFIDFVNGLPAVARRMAGPERRQELQIWRSLSPLPPAGETPGLARQVLKRWLEGLEPPGETLGTDQAIGGRRGNGDGRGARAAHRAATVGSGGEKTWMRGTIRVNFMARTGLKRFRGSKS